MNDFITLNCLEYKVVPKVTVKFLFPEKAGKALFFCHFSRIRIRAPGEKTQKRAETVTQRHGFGLSHYENSYSPLSFESCRPVDHQRGFELHIQLAVRYALKSGELPDPSEPVPDRVLMAVQGCGGLRNISAVPDIFLYRFLQIAAAGNGLQDIPRKGWSFLVFEGGDEDAAGPAAGETIKGFSFQD